MLEIYPLFSSSSGNMYLIKSSNANILVDIGITYKKAIDSLKELGLTSSDIDAICITHEHTDHIKGLPMFIKYNPDINIYCSKGTSIYLNQLLKDKKIPLSNNITVTVPEKKYNIKDIEIVCFNTSHDAVDPVGYKLCSSGKHITIATDLGTVTDNVLEHLKGSDFSIIESNYDKDILLAGKYPFELKRRIQGSFGHLSNDDSGQIIVELAKEGKRNFLLSHLSEHNNMPCIAKENVLSCLSIAGFNTDEFNINLASKDFSTEAYIL